MAETLLRLLVGEGVSLQFDHLLQNQPTGNPIRAARGSTTITIARTMIESSFKGTTR